MLGFLLGVLFCALVQAVWRAVQVRGCNAHSMRVQAPRGVWWAAAGARELQCATAPPYLAAGCPAEAAGGGDQRQRRGRRAGHARRRGMWRTAAHPIRPQLLL